MTGGGAPAPGGWQPVSRAHPPRNQPLTIPGSGPKHKAMSTIDPLALAGAKAKGKRPWFIDPDNERLMNMLLVVIQELAVTRERMDTLERLLEQSGTLTRAQIETFAPTKDEADARGAWMQEYLARVFRILQQDREALANGTEQSSEDVAEELAQR